MNQQFLSISIQFKQLYELNQINIWHVTANELINLNQVLNIFAKYCTLARERPL